MRKCLNNFSNTVPLALAKNSDDTVKYLLGVVRPEQMPLLKGLTKVSELQLSSQMTQLSKMEKIMKSLRNFINAVRYRGFLWHRHQRLYALETDV